jgi:hypothetical protein
MTATAAPARATAGGERFARQTVTWCGVLVGLACFGFSFGNVLALGRHLAVPGYVAWLVAPAVDLTLVGLIVGIRYLSLRGVAGRRLRPARLLLICAGLATLALNTAHGLFVRRHLGVVAYDSLAPLLLIGWAEVGPWFLRQFTTTSLTVDNRADADGPREVVAAQAGRPAAQPRARTLAGRGADAVPPSSGRPAARDLAPPRRAAGLAAQGRAGGDRAVASHDQVLVERARALNAAHWETHGRQISRDKLRAALGVGATRAERLLAALAANPHTVSPLPLTPAPAQAALPARWAAMPAAAPARPGGPEQDGAHG